MGSVSVCLSEFERRSVEELKRKTRSIVESQRCRILLLLSDGLGVAQVKERAGCVRSTVYTTAYRFEEQGLEGLYDARLAAAPRKATAEVREQLLDYLDDVPKDYGWQRSTWTRELLALQLEADMGVQLSISHLGHVLRQEKVRRGRPRPALRIPVKGRGNRIKEIQAIAKNASPEDEVFYVDEADIDLNPRIGTMYIKRGTQPLVLTPGENVKYYIAGALNCRTGRVLYTHGARKDSSLFCALLDTLHRAYRPPKRIHLILDNYIIHKSQKTLGSLEKLNGRIQTHFLPPYSPEHNNIERLWKQLHDNVTRNHRHPNMMELWKDVTQFLKQVQPFPGTKVSTNRRAA
jgi:putative transposase